MPKQQDQWIEDARRVLSQLFTGYEREVTGQQLRADLEFLVGRPIDNPNTFGPYVAQQVRDGLICKTGKRVPMTGREAHGRLTPVYTI
jgi:hypothetical protein